MTETNEIAKKLGITPRISEQTKRKQKIWRDIYSGNPSWLYSEKGRDNSMRTLNLAATIAAKTAKTVMLEAEIALSGGKRAEAISAFFNPFLEKLRRNTEYAAALGGVIFKPYVVGKEIFIETVLPENFLPTAANGRGEILGAIFAETLEKEGKIYVKLEHHEKKGEDYFIENHAFMSTEKGKLGEEISLKSVLEWANIEKCVKISGLRKPLFTYFGMPSSNTVEPLSPLGVSIFANATDLMREADRQFSRILWEFEGSELAIDADITALSDGDLPERDRRLFRNTRFQGGDTTGDFYQVFSPAIRDSSLFNGLDKILKQIENACGLSFGMLSDAQSADKTATEIKASRQDMYTTTTEIQKSLESALHNLLYAINVLADLYQLAPTGEAKLLINFGDSVLTDPEVEKAQDQTEVSMGLLTPFEYRMKWFGEDEKTAKAMIAEFAGAEEQAEREEETDEPNRFGDK